MMLAGALAMAGRIDLLAAFAVAVLASLVAMLLLSWQLTVVSLVMLPFFLWLQVRVGRVRRRLATRTQSSLSDMTAITEESLSVSGVLLVFVAAGILKYGVHDFQEAGVLPGLDVLAFDISGVLDPNSWYGAAIAGMFNITAAPTVLESIAYLAYLVPVLTVFLWPSRRPTAPRTGAVPGTPQNSENSQHVPA